MPARRLGGTLAGYGPMSHIHYNFVRIHQNLKVTPAMAAEVAGKLMTLEDMMTIVEV